MGYLWLFMRRLLVAGPLSSVVMVGGAPAGLGSRSTFRPGATPRWRGRLLTAVRRRIGPSALRRRVLPADSLPLAVVSLVAIGVGALSAAIPRWFPLASLALVLFVGGVALTRRSLVLLSVLVAVLGLFVTWWRWGTSMPVRPGNWLVLASAVAFVFVAARDRSRLGLRGGKGESMLVDLRDRLRAQGEMPMLPAGWGAEVVLRNAYGDSFSGDFLVASRDGSVLEVVLVDVSGKGLDAGSRALLLSGAFGGLLGAMPSEEFLPAANRYLLRQRWEEGFATAVHLVTDLRTGDFVLRYAGHPPSAQFSAGSGQWRVLDSVGGPVLGVVEIDSFPHCAGRLRPGDALLLYTDGLIESPGRDLSVGIDRLLGHAERLVTSSFRDGARRLVEAVGDGDGDDRALIIFWRE